MALSADIETSTPTGPFAIDTATCHTPGAALAETPHAHTHPSKFRVYPPKHLISRLLVPPRHVHFQNALRSLRSSDQLRGPGAPASLQCSSSLPHQHGMPQARPSPATTGTQARRATPSSSKPLTSYAERFRLQRCNRYISSSSRRVLHHHRYRCVGRRR